MTQRVLVAYASRAGSTAGIAEAIGKELANGADGRWAIEVRSMAEVKAVTPYQAVVSGSAIHGGRWLPEALEFVETHRQALQSRPFAAFLVCITLSVRDAGRYREGIAEWMAPVRGLVRPVAEGYFAGALDFRQLPLTKDTLLMRLPVLFGAWKTGDHRDWEAIRVWAAQIARLL